MESIDLRRILRVWLIANLALIGLVSLALGGWYLSRPPLLAMPLELTFIMLPNLVLPLVALRRVLGPPWRSKAASALGWRWAGARTVLVGLGGFSLIVLSQRIIAQAVGPSIPYNLPDGGGPLQVRSLGGAIGVLVLLALFVGLTVAGEETMFRGFIQGQVSGRYGAWAGVLLAALLFGLRHLPADIFYGRAWAATPGMWLARQLELYATALTLGLARHLGRSTYASALAHALLLLMALFG